jgi:hypothetical protein
MTSNIKCPCKDCADRLVGCHSTCEKYKEYKQLLSELPKDKREDVYLSYFANVIFRERKKKNERNNT